MLQIQHIRKERKMNKKAYYGQFGGQYVAESLMNTLQELDQAYEEAIHDPECRKQNGGSWCMPCMRQCGLP